MRRNRVIDRGGWMAMVCMVVGLVLACAGCSTERSPTTLPGTHPASWVDVDSPDFHGEVVRATGTGSCIECHGHDLDGGKVGVSCVACHLQSPGACTGCHGGIDNETGAPPLGLRGEDDDSALAVGAHTVHLEGSTLFDGDACQTCHAVPAISFDTLHLDGTPGPGHIVDSVAEITWHGIADGGNATWDRTTRTCADVYCHGNFAGGDGTNTPVWTAANQADCGSCHDVGAAPAALQWRHEFHMVTAALNCADCHASVIDTQLNVIALDLHVNGAIDTLTRDTTLCLVCHGPGGTSCTACHGGTDNPTGAPPEGLRGEVATTELAVGAHTGHVEGGSLADAFECTECHVKPAVLADAGHLGTDSIAEMTWGGIAPAAGISWNRVSASCANTYCHGNFAGGDGTNTPVWTAANQAECGSCHDVGTSPGQLGGEHERHVREENISCRRCHSLTVDLGLNIVGTDVHVNKQREVSFSTGQGTWNGTSCTNTGCHGSERWY